MLADETECGFSSRMLMYKTNKTNELRRNVSKKYFLTTESNGCVQVYLKTFLSTLGKTDNSIRYWTEHSKKL